MQTGAISRIAPPLWLYVVLAFSAVASHGGDGYYEEPKVYGSRPRIDHEMHVGHIGVTGIKARYYPGPVLKVEEVEPGSPAEGKCQKGDEITALGGVVLRGKNGFVVMGDALTRAEATDGKLELALVSEGKATRVTVVIPVLGAYSRSWPLNCPKSKKIIEQAAAFYSRNVTGNKGEDNGMTGALACLFLLSTGDDTYLPAVKAYFARMVANPEGIGDHTWNNGYNGIACAEYFLRTGDTSVMPVLQYFCDDAKERQKFGCGWTHWGHGISPRYVASGLMNPAGAQVLTTLLLAKECGADVDEKALLGALRFFYRFAGHGTVPYGDHRGEGGLGSNGKDGMVAAAMLIASHAQGDVSSYVDAKRYLSMATLTSYPGLVRGHADEGRGDGIWRGIVSSYLMDEKPVMYREAMDRLTWWHDLSRRPGGGFGVATCQRFDDTGSGAGVAMAYTAPLKTLRITGAPRSKYAKDFELPEQVWGRPADRAFLNIEHHPKYLASGPPEPTHVPFNRFGSAYSKPSADLDSVSRDEMLRNVYHQRYMIRAQAAKALRTVGALDELETLLQDRDPRIRRAALDGIVDYNYWFGPGRNALGQERYTPSLITSLQRIVGDPDEALYVVDGALFAMRHMPAEAIHQSLEQILPFTQHEDWWLRESAFAALSGLERSDTLYEEALPILIGMMIREYHTQPRERMVGHLRRTLDKHSPQSVIGAAIVAGLVKATASSVVLSGERSGEGVHNVLEAARASLRATPETAVEIATILKDRLAQMDTGQIVGLVGAPSSNPENPPFGLYSVLGALAGESRAELTDILYDVYRPELIARMKAESNMNIAQVDTILDLTRLRKPVTGWQPIGSPVPSERVWRFTSFDPQASDRIHPREKKRFRDVSLPVGLDKWTAPDFDASTWTAGKAPIGKGVFQRGETLFESRSEWGEGEFLLMRTAFDLEAVDCDAYRISILANQGFHVYLNGKPIHTYVWWKDMPHYRLIMLGPDQTKHLRQGRNVLAVYTNAEYPQAMAPPHKKATAIPVRAQIDCSIEGLKKADLE